MKLGLTDVTFVDAMKVKKAVNRAIDSGDLTLDFTGVTHVDSTMIAVALHAQRRADAKGGKITLIGTPAGFQELVSLYGLEEMFAQLR